MSSTSKYQSDDIDLLLPSFAIVVRRLLDKLVNRRFLPIPFDTLRTPKEAAKFAAKGVGSADSMHIYGAACDVICDVHGWHCDRHGCLFFRALGNEAELLGLTWGGRWTKPHDLAHLQACTQEQRAEVRAIADWEERDRHVAKLLADTLLAADGGW